MELASLSIRGVGNSSGHRGGNRGGIGDRGDSSGHGGGIGDRGGSSDGSDRGGLNLDGFGGHRGGSKGVSGSGVTGVGNGGEGVGQRLDLLGGQTNGQKSCNDCEEFHVATSCVMLNGMAA